jgi:transcriptional regulator with XRE-family HTH domain
MEEVLINIGKRLLALRAAKNLSQGDIKRRSGLFYCHVFRVENGHTTPSFETLQRLAKAPEFEVYQLFFEGEGKPEPVPPGAMEPLDRREGELLGFFQRVDEADKQRMLDITCKMTRNAA